MIWHCRRTRRSGVGPWLVAGARRFAGSFMVDGIRQPVPVFLRQRALQVDCEIGELDAVRSAVVGACVFHMSGGRLDGILKAVSRHEETENRLRDIRGRHFDFRHRGGPAYEARREAVGEEDG